MLWFDVEKRYNTTYLSLFGSLFLLWFDVEKRYNTTPIPHTSASGELWFDVEKRYNTTFKNVLVFGDSCGLM